jgi:tetratricopeptide (TPR) repeat protein
MLWPLRWRSARAAIALGDRLYRRGNTDGALRAFRRAMDTDSHHGAPAGAWWTANLLRRQGDQVAAQSCYQQAIDSRHEAWAPRAATDLADMLTEQGKTSLASTYYRQAIAYGDPTNPGAIWARRAQQKLDALQAGTGE